MPRTLSSTTIRAGAQNPLPGFAYMCKFQCKFLFKLSSRSKHSPSAVNRSSVGSDPFRSGGEGSVGMACSVGMAWRGRFDVDRSVDFSQSSAVDSARAISVSSKAFGSGSVCPRPCSSLTGGQRARLSPRPNQCPSQCPGPDPVQAQAKVYVRVQAQDHVQVQARVQVHGQIRVSSTSRMFGRRF